MIIQQDTREQQGKKDHILKYFADNDIKVVRSKLFVGDWTRLDKQDICIDTKFGCAEVYSNIVQQHVRFRDECIRAQQCGIKLIILVEDESITDLRGVEHWKNPRYIQWCKIRSMHEAGKALNLKQPKQPPLSSIQLMDRMKVMAERYGIEWQFTPKAECGRRIVEILGGGT